MSSSNRRPRRCSGAIVGRGARCGLVAAAACLVMSAGGCGSGSGGSAAAAGARGEVLQASPPPAPPVPGGVRLTVTVKDVSGAPVPGATVSVFRRGAAAVSLVADDDGRAEIVGDYSKVYGVAASATDRYGYSPEPTQLANDRIDFLVTLHPSAALTGGGSDDGRSRGSEGAKGHD